MVWCELIKYSKSYSSSKLVAFSIEIAKDGSLSKGGQDFFNRDKNREFEAKVKVSCCDQLKYLPLRRSLILNGQVLWKLQRLQ